MPNSLNRISVHIVIMSAGMFLLSSCFVRKTYYHQGFEPVKSPEEQVLQSTLTFQPSMVLKASATVSLGRYLLLRGGYSGRVHVDGFNGALLFYKGVRRYGFFGGPLYEYQHNLRTKPGIFPMFGYYAINYNCEYVSPGMVAGFSYSYQGESVQVILKGCRNLVQQYRMMYISGDGSGKDVALTFDHEKLERRIPDFNSAELNVIYMRHTKNKNIDFKVQAVVLYCQKTLTHNYFFSSQQEFRSLPDQTGTRNHPVSGNLALNFGFVFSLPRHHSTIQTNQ